MDAQDLYPLTISRLSMLGYHAGENDRSALEYQLVKCRAALLANLNRRELPAELLCTLADMAVGSFLHDKLSAGCLEIAGLDFSAQVKSITEGDVSVTFAGAGDGADSPESRFCARLEELRHPSEHVLGAFRRLRW